MAIIQKQCIEFAGAKRGKEPGDLRECAVSEFGEFGSIGGQTYYFALYCLIPNYADKGRCGDGSFVGSFYALKRGLGIFTGEPGSGRVQLLLERVNPGTEKYSRPQIIRSAGALFLEIPVAVDGAGALDANEYFLRNGSGWTPLETRKWLDDLERRIPSDLTMRKGVWPNLGTMRAEAELYRDEDSDCCPTGGTAKIALAIRSGRVVIESVAFEKNP